MRVKLTCDRATALTLQREGDIVEVSNAEGARLIKAGQAVLPADNESTPPASPATKGKR